MVVLHLLGFLVHGVRINAHYGFQHNMKVWA